MAKYQFSKIAEIYSGYAIQNTLTSSKTC